jgi:hypothetical protein
MSAGKKRSTKRVRAASAADSSAHAIRRRILLLRGKRVLIDADLARFYGVQTRDLNKAVARNRARFPEDFAFRLTMQEMRDLMFQSGTSNAGSGEASAALMFQSGTSNQDGSPVAEKSAPGAQSAGKRGGTRKPATVFTEQGVAMLASVLRSERAVAMSIAIVRAFVQVREMLTQNQQLTGKLAELERKIESHDGSIANLFEAIRQLLVTPDPEHERKIGFHRGNR